MIEKYNRVKETPSYQVERTHMKDLIPDKKYELAHLGLYQSKNYGETCYADIMINGKRLRFSLPSRMINQIDEMSHDDEVMKEIHDGKSMISLKPYKTKAGNTTFIVTFSTKDQ